MTVAAPVTRDEVKTVFTEQKVGPANKSVKGATVRTIKDKFRGRVPRDQRLFVRFMDTLGFKSEWSNQASAWVYY
jgi:hypothetical protein